MSRYSINGYLIALQTRSTHTVCTEGKDDRFAVKHCLLRLVGDKEHLNTRYVVDTMDIIESKERTLGNSDKLRIICTLLQGSPISSKVTALKDREYEWFDIGKSEIDLSPSHQSQYGHLYYTRGHSIENYFFEPEYFIQYIEFNHAAALTANHRELIVSNWEVLLSLAASLTFAIHEYSCCTKAKGLFSLHHWQDVGKGRLKLKISEVETSLTSRGVLPTQLVNILARASSLQATFLGRIVVSRWITHGHIGLDLLCGAIGRILTICGVDSGTCEQVNGFYETKLKHFVSQWFDKAKSSDDLFPLTFFKRILSAIEN